MMNWLTTLPAALALAGGLWFAAPPAAIAQDDCIPVYLCFLIDGELHCIQIDCI